MEVKDYKLMTRTIKEENLNSVVDDFGVRYTAEGKN